MIHDFLSSSIHHQIFYFPTKLPWRFWDHYPFLLYGLIGLGSLLFSLGSPWAILPIACLAITAYTRLPTICLLFLFSLFFLQFREVPTMQHKRLSSDSGARHVQTIKAKDAPQAKSLTPSLEHYRHLCRQNFFYRFEHPDTLRLLSGMLTEHGNSLFLNKRLEKLGLSFLLTLSGVYGLLLTILFYVPLLTVLSRPSALISLMGVSTLWYLVTAPSSAWIWIATQLYLGSLLFDIPISWRNALGLSLLIDLCVKPLHCLALSLHFPLLLLLGLSFLPIEHWNRPQKLYDLLKKWVTSVLLTSVALLPYTLYQEHVFYLHSLFYRCFFLPLASLSIVLLPFSAVCDAYVHLIYRCLISPPILCQGYYLNMTQAHLAMSLSFLILLAIAKKEVLLNNV